MMNNLNIQENIKKTTCFLVFLLVSSQFVFTQEIFTGIVTDDKQETLTGAQILLFVGDSLYAGALTDNTGEFFIQNLPTGEYQIRILYAGFTPLEESVRIMSGNMKYNYMLLKEMTSELDEVVITANLSDLVKRTATGQIFRLSEQAKNSGDPYRALKEIPRLIVNESLRTVSVEDGTTPY